MPRHTCAAIHLQRLRDNVGRVRELAPNSRILGCVKANAYGHGLVEVSRILEPLCDGLGTATLEEATILREKGIRCPILLLEGVHSAGDWEQAAALDLCVTITHREQLDWLLASPRRNWPGLWLKVDTGMHRLGIAPDEVRDLHKQLRPLCASGSLPVLMTHFAAADDPQSTMTATQLQRFMNCTEGLDLPRSSANSAAILNRPDSHFDWVRPGYMLYGGSPFMDRGSQQLRLQPVMEFRAQVISVREVATGERVGYGGRWQATRPSRIATISAGYGDGYPRHAPDATPVMIHGQRAPLAGTVSMDMLTVDVTDITNCRPGDGVLLWGEGLTVEEIAAASGTIGYELLAGMPERVPRLHVP